MKINTKINLLRIFLYFEFIIFFITGYMNPEGAFAGVVVGVFALAGVSAFIGASGVVTFVGAIAGASALALAGAFASVIALAVGVVVGVVIAGLVLAGFAGTVEIFLDIIKSSLLEEEEAYNEN